MAEVRTLPEGELWWVQASGSGTAWATASAPASGLFGYVQEGGSFTSAQTLTTIMDRGVPTHHKVTDKQPITLSFTVLWTGNTPQANSGSGASVPMWHLEHKAKAPENGNTGVYHQFHGAASESVQWTEQGAGNQLALSMRALAMNGPTASGYLK